MALTARSGWALTLRTATSLTTLQVRTLVTTIGTALGMRRTPKPCSASARLRCYTIAGLCWVLFAA